jgi:hypothetical protein
MWVSICLIAYTEAAWAIFLWVIWRDLTLSYTHCGTISHGELSFVALSDTSASHSYQDSWRNLNNQRSIQFEVIVLYKSNKFLLVVTHIMKGILNSTMNYNKFTVFCKTNVHVSITLEININVIDDISRWQIFDS